MIDWGKQAKTLIKLEMTRQDLAYKDLQAKLDDIGVELEEAAIRNKINRGTFSAIFLLQCMKAMGIESLQLPE